MVIKNLKRNAIGKKRESTGRGSLWPGRVPKGSSIWRNKAEESRKVSSGTGPDLTASNLSPRRARDRDGGESLINLEVTTASAASDERG